MSPGGKASEIWPEDRRAAFCYSARQGKETESCNAKEGSPFGPFWDNFNITFHHSELYGPLHYDIHHGSTVKDWNEKFSSTRWDSLFNPVLKAKLKPIDRFTCRVWSGPKPFQ